MATVEPSETKRLSTTLIVVEQRGSKSSGRVAPEERFLFVCKYLSGVSPDQNFMLISLWVLNREMQQDNRTRGYSIGTNVAFVRCSSGNIKGVINGSIGCFGGGGRPRDGPGCGHRNFMHRATGCPSCHQTLRHNFRQNHKV